MAIQLQFQLHFSAKRWQENKKRVREKKTQRALTKLRSIGTKINFAMMLIGHFYANDCAHLSLTSQHTRHILTHINFQPVFMFNLICSRERQICKTAEKIEKNKKLVEKKSDTFHKIKRVTQQQQQQKNHFSLHTLSGAALQTHNNNNVLGCCCCSLFNFFFFCSLMLASLPLQYRCVS